MSNTHDDKRQRRNNTDIYNSYAIGFAFCLLYDIASSMIYWLSASFFTHFIISIVMGIVIAFIGFRFALYISKKEATNE